ncbi:MAG: helix-turn-helix transcriptional regulator [Acidobacteriota bacterium]|jgi:DNA-binding PadR family transcriptional regulator
MPRESLGEFEQLVLLACLRLGDDAYAVPIIDEIAARTGRETSHAAVYVALKRMEKKGLVSSYMSAPVAERGGRSRRCFEVLPEAMEQLRASRDALLNMWDGVEAQR